MICIVVFMFSIFFAWLAERSKDKGIIILCSVISILAPAILGGLRAHGMGIDTVTYGLPDALQALNSPDLAYFMSNNRSEPRYKLLCYFTMKTFGHVNWCYFFYQLITISCFYIGAYKHRKIAPFTLIMLIFFLMSYQRTYSGMRQHMAMSIIFMGLDNVEKGQYNKFILYVCLATMFHYSSVIAIILIMGMHLVTVSENFAKHTYIKFTLVSLAAILLVFARQIMYIIASFIPFLMKYTHYLSSNSSLYYISTQLSMVLIFIGELIMFMIYGKQASSIFAEGENNNNNINFFKYNLLFLIIFQVAVHFFVRVLRYSEFANIIALSALPKFVREKYLKIMVIFAVIAVVTAYCTRTYVIMNYSRTWPYRSILD